ncbi:MAG TPA: hypothetical protein VF060_24795 [Trebonia sp.]
MRNTDTAGTGRAPARTAGQDTAPATVDRLERRIRALRLNSAGICMMLIAEYGLGIGVNLYVKVPTADQGHGIATALGRALTSQPATLVVHAGLGVLMILAALSVLARAILARHRFAIGAAATGLAAIVGAAVSGATFVSSGRDAASMAMAMLTGVALLCYLGNLFVVGVGADRGASIRSDISNQMSS